MGDATILKCPDQISLTRHGVIEAHAGTGKTYTIIRLVLRMLQQRVSDGKACERRVHIRDILLVTYTEKAAGELKTRIRKGLEERIGALVEENKDMELAGHLEDCLNNLHEALIGTIHSVCLRLLQTWPFETGVHFDTEIVDDDEGLEMQLRQSMRTDWQDPETSIPWALETLKKNGAVLAEKHFTLMRQTAKEILDSEHAILDRSIVQGANLAAMRDKDGQLQSDISKSQFGFKQSLGKLIDDLERAKDAGNLDKSRANMLESRLRELRQMQSTNSFDTARLSQPIRVDRSQIVTKALAGKHQELSELWEQAQNVSNHQHLTKLKERDQLVESLILTLICDAAGILAQRWNEYKHSHGLIAYTDMLQLMHKAVNANPEFVESLRKRIRFAVIDEFQDTSIVQWEVFERLFVDKVPSDGSRLFIVGDPKQSIYAFQGADVNSYLAAKRAVVGQGGHLYYLDKNYRSLPQTIAGYNEILGRRDPDSKKDDWFKFSENDQFGIFYPAEGDAGRCAEPADRETGPAHTISRPHVQAMLLEGSAPRRRSEMAAHAERVIKSMRGTTVSIPDGAGWRELTLDYKDFAVIVEKHALASFFLARFSGEGIPAVKYKMEGVFQSNMARDLHALLRALLHREGKPEARLAALLTCFFNRPPADIDPDHELEPCSRGAACRQGRTCIAHALEEWSGLVDSLKWSQLFRSIQERTGIRERLMRLCDGERHLADLRQVIDYCVEKIYRDNYDLQTLTEQLGRLIREEESVGGDRNLHVLATEKSCVKVLTMHAAKGLEFPVVFVATGGSSKLRSGSGTLKWLGADRKHHTMPVLSTSQATTAENPALEEAANKCKMQQAQERRRLIYVALTRAQAMLFVPLHLKSIAKKQNGDVDFAACNKDGKPPDDDLTPVLRYLLKQRNKLVEAFDENKWNDDPTGIDEVTSSRDTATLSEIPDIGKLGLAKKVSWQTSYSQLSRRVAHDRDVDRSDEAEELDESPIGYARMAPPVLPAGKGTGDALHLVIEEILLLDNPHTVLSEWEELRRRVEARLSRNGVLRRVNDHVEEEQAIVMAAHYVHSALTTPLTLPEIDTQIAPADVPRQDRIPEMEFLLGEKPHWVHGYMDLVFRVPTGGNGHGYRYYVLDWKSDQLPQFTTQDLADAMKQRHYDLQAQVYCHALNTHLAGVLGGTYDPKINLGGAVYVFLRGFGDDEYEDVAKVLFRPARSHKDREFTLARLGEL